MNVHVVGGRTYVPKGDHRDGTKVKSQWTVGVPEEVESFRLSVDEGWTRGQLAWGLHVVDGAAGYLGKAAENPGPDRDLFVALFELAQVCHGFPADPRRSDREKPPSNVRKAWLAQGLLRPAVIRKIGRGQRCGL